MWKSLTKKRPTSHILLFGKWVGPRIFKHLLIYLVCLCTWKTVIKYTICFINIVIRFSGNFPTFFFFFKPEVDTYFCNVFLKTWVIRMFYVNLQVMFIFFYKLNSHLNYILTKCWKLINENIRFFSIWSIFFILPSWESFSHLKIIWEAI